MVRFYTLPPFEIGWPFVLINANNPNGGLKYVRMHRPKGVIIDSGVEIFRDPNVKEYPPNHIYRLIYLFKYVRKYSDEVHVTIPDYPDDYNPGSLWVDGKDNIERTVENVIKYIDMYPKVDWLVPIQGHNEDPSSIIKSIGLYDEMGILDRFEYFAIANLCVSKKMGTIVKTVNTAYLYLPQKRLHAFGISLNAVKRLGGKLFSFDSMAWTFPRGRGGHSVRNERERKLYFMRYLETLRGEKWDGQ